MSVVRIKGYTGDISAARSIQTGNEVVTDRIAAVCKYDWDRAGGCLGCTRRNRQANCKNYGDLATTSSAASAAQPIKFTIR